MQAEIRVDVSPTKIQKQRDGSEKLSVVEDMEADEHFKSFAMMQE